MWRMPDTVPGVEDAIMSKTEAIPVLLALRIWPGKDFSEVLYTTEH